MELGGATSTLPSGDRAVFPNNKLVSAATTSLSIALTILQWNCAELSLQQPCKILSHSDGAIFADLRYTEPCQVRTGIGTSLGHGLQSPAQRFFGRSNRSSTAEFPYLPPLQISARSDGSNSGNLLMSGPIFGSVSCANTDPTRIHVSL